MTIPTQTEHAPQTFTRTLNYSIVRHQYLNQPALNALTESGEASIIATLQSIGYEIDVVLDVRDTQNFVAYVCTGETIPHAVVAGAEIIAVEREALRLATELMLDDLRLEINPQ